MTIVADRETRMTRLMPPLRIAELHEKRGLSRRDLGLIASNHPNPALASPAEQEAAESEIRDYEIGERAPSWERLIAIAQTLGCEDVLDLFSPMRVREWSPKLVDAETQARTAGVVAHTPRREPRRVPQPKLAAERAQRGVNRTKHSKRRRARSA